MTETDLADINESLEVLTEKIEQINDTLKRIADEMYKEHL